MVEEWSVAFAVAAAVAASVERASVEVGAEGKASRRELASFGRQNGASERRRNSLVMTL